MQTISGRRLVALVCVAQILVQLGAFFWPALLPSMIPLWGLTNSEAGWISGIFYAAYVLSVPLLVTLTDRLDARAIYLTGVACTVVGHLLFGLVAEGFWSALGLRALTGLGWAGTYMTGLRVLAEKVDAKMMSRAVAAHAASIGISGSLSYACAGFVATHYGWSAAFVVAGLSAAAAWLLVALWVPRQQAAPAAPGVKLFDFRPVFRNRSAMAYSLAYCAHTLEMSALRGWGVAFLGFVAIGTGVGGSGLAPTLVMTVLGLVGTAASFIGNEGAIRIGRRKLIGLAMLASAVIGACIGFVGTISYPIAVGMLFAYVIVIWLDSSSLTAGSAGTAEPSRRGATLAVHSTLGYAGGFVGPLIVGFMLDVGGMSRTSWGWAFLAVAVLMLLALAAFWAMRPRELEGDAGDR